MTPLPADLVRIWATTWRTSRVGDGAADPDGEGLGDVGEARSTSPRRGAPRRATNIVAPIASHRTTASSGERADDPAGQAARHHRRLGPSGRVGGGRRIGAVAGHGLASRRNQPVADAADGLDRRPVRPELPADLADVDVDRPGLAREVGAPDVLEERVAGQDDAGIAGEGGQQVELAGAQAEVAAGDGRLAPARIDPERADLDRPAAAGRRRRSGGGSP